jgi:RNA polymerase sigma-70 factor (ECF subfamily)
VLSEQSSCALARAKTDARAFVEFYDAYFERVLRFVGSRVLDAEVAVDVVSETFAKALERREQFRGDTEEAERAWVFAIAASELSHFWRKGKVQRAAVRRMGIVVPALADEELERIENRMGVQAVATKLREQMQRLPSEQQEAINLRVLEDFSYAEIALRARVTPQVARARVSRGLRSLAKSLAGDGVIAEDVVG